MPFDPGYDYKTHTLYRSIAADYQPKRAELEICRYIERLVTHTDTLEARARARVAELEAQITELDARIAELEARIATLGADDAPGAVDRPIRGRNKPKTEEAEATEETPEH